MTTDPSPRTVRLDSAQLRVLAHPLRARLLGTLRLYGPDTSTGLAERLSTNSGATSYHLRKLGDVGLVHENEDRGVGRERWWQASHEVTSWVETDFSDDPDDKAAADWLFGQHAMTKSQWIADWFAMRDRWADEWRDAADSSDFELQLGPTQLTALRDDLHDVIERYRTAGSEPGSDIQRVIVLLDAFPSPEPRI